MNAATESRAARRARGLILPVVAVLAVCAGVFGSGNPSAAIAPTLPRGEQSISYHPYSFGYVREGFLGDRRQRNRILFARTRKDGVRWGRWLTHRRTTPPGDAYFAAETLVGVFLLGNAAAQGVEVTGATVSDNTLALTLEVSSLPVGRCGNDPDLGYACQAMFSAPRGYHAMTIISVPRKSMTAVTRVVVTREVDVPGAIEVDYPG
jgi:hypothetical protein